MKTNITIFKLFALASTFTFSGGLATIPMLHEELVNKERFMNSDTFYHYVSLGQTIPGVQVVSVACLLGYKINGHFGRFFASVGAIAPVFVIMSLLSAAYQYIPQTGIIIYVLSALRASAGVYIIETVLEMYPHITKGRKKLNFIIPISACILAFLPIPSGLVLILFSMLAIASVALEKDIL